MDSETYLNQISRSNRKFSNGNSFLSSKILKIGIAVMAATILIIALSSILDPGDTTKNKIMALKLHSENLTGVINDYRPLIKSSKLRTNSISISSILESLNASLDTYIAKKYKDAKNIDKSVTKKEEELATKLSDDLFNARINGLLDRTYVSKIAYELTVITTREKEVAKLVKDADLKSALESSLNSLNNLYNSFSDYSETN